MEGGGQVPIEEELSQWEEHFDCHDDIFSQIKTSCWNVTSRRFLINLCFVSQWLQVDITYCHDVASWA